MALPIASILPKHVIQKYPNSWTKKQHIVSNGPYVIENYMDGTDIKLKKNNSYYDTNGVPVENIIIKNDGFVKSPITLSA